MVKSTRREYLETIRRRYRKAHKKDKKPILDEFYANSRAAAFFPSLFVAVFRHQAWKNDINGSPITPQVPLLHH